MATKFIILFISFTIASVYCRRHSHIQRYQPTTEEISSTEKTWTSTHETTTTEEHFGNALYESETPIEPFKNVTNLESLLLEAIRIAGPSVCNSPLARVVLLGTWRDGKYSSDELKQLRVECFKTIVTTSGPIYTPRHLKTQPSPPVVAVRTSAEIFYSLVQPKPTLRAVAFASPAAPRSEEGPLDKETLQKVNAIIKDRSAECKPRKVPVEIPREPSIIWLPSCTLIERCGGCCKHESLRCVPVPEGITFVNKTVVAVGSKGTHLGIKQVKIEKHNKCRCECKVKQEDCNEFQKYDSRNCQCVCKADKKTKLLCTSPQYWDEQSCRCQCPNVTSTECSTGSYFASHLCKCVTVDEIVTEQTKRSKP